MNTAQNASRWSARSRHFLTQAIIIAVSAWYFLPRMLLTLQTEKTKAAVGGSAETTTPLAHSIERLLFYCAFALCAWIIVSFWTKSPSSRGLVLISLLAPFVYLTTRDLYADQPPQMATVLTLLIIVALWMLRPPIQSLALVGYLVGLVSLASVVVAILLPSHGLLRSAITQGYIDPDKAILPWGILIGVTSGGNTLGVFLALGVPCIFLIPQRILRTVLLIVSLFAIVWTASRGSMLAVAMSAVTALVLSRSHPDRRFKGTVACCCVSFAVPVLLPWFTHDPEAFSNRGWIWSASEQAWGQNPVFGLGSGWFQRIGSSTEALGPTVFHAHNQILQILVLGGAVYALIFGATLVIAISSAAKLAKDTVVPAAYLAAIAGCSIFELSLTTIENQLLTPVSLLPLTRWRRTSGTSVTVRSR